MGIDTFLYNREQVTRLALKRTERREVTDAIAEALAYVCGDPYAEVDDATWDPTWVAMTRD